MDGVPFAGTTSCPLFVSNRGHSEISEDLPRSVSNRFHPHSSGLRYSISSHGCEYSLTNMIDLLGLEKRALGERVHKILEFVDSSALCSMLVENTGTMTMSSSRYFPSSVTSSSAVMALVVPIAEK